MRKCADKYGLIFPLCRECHMRLHDNGDYDKYLQVQSEIMWLKQDYNRSIQDFIEEAGKNFL